MDAPVLAAIVEGLRRGEVRGKLVYTQPPALPADDVHSARGAGGFSLSRRLAPEFRISPGGGSLGPTPLSNVGSHNSHSLTTALGDLKLDTSRRRIERGRPHGRPLCWLARGRDPTYETVVRGSSNDRTKPTSDRYSMMRCAFASAVTRTVSRVTSGFNGAS